MKKKYRMVSVGENKFLIQEDSFLLGFIWWSTGFVSNLSMSKQTVVFNLKAYQEKEFQRLGNQLTWLAIILTCVAIKILLK